INLGAAFASDSNMAEGRQGSIALLGQFYEHDHEWSSVIRHPGYAGPSLRPLMHDLHAGIAEVERNAFFKLAHTQGHVGQPNIRRLTPKASITRRSCAIRSR